MPWCPKCKVEYRDGYEKCSDCGSTLVSECTHIEKRKSIVLRLIVLGIVMLTLAVVYTFPQRSSDKETNVAKGVVKAYFKYMNHKQYDKAYKLFYSYDKTYRANSLPDNNRYIKLTYIKAAPNLINGFVHAGLGKVIKPYRTRIFEITYITLYKNNRREVDPRFLNSKEIVLIKKTSASDWRIVEIGEG